MLWIHLLLFCVGQPCLLYPQNAIVKCQGKLVMTCLFKKAYLLGYRHAYYREAPYIFLTSNVYVLNVLYLFLCQGLILRNLWSDPEHFLHNNSQWPINSNNPKIVGMCTLKGRLSPKNMSKIAQTLRILSSRFHTATKFPNLRKLVKTGKKLVGNSRETLHKTHQMISVYNYVARRQVWRKDASVAHNSQAAVTPCLKLNRLPLQRKMALLS